MNSSASLGAFIIAFIITFLIFLVLRELVMWYWKINKVVGLLEEIRDLLQKNPGNT